METQTYANSTDSKLAAAANYDPVPNGGPTIC